MLLCSTDERLTAVEDVSAKQAKLIKKLRCECQSLSNNLDALTNKYREEIGFLGQKNEHLTIHTHRYVQCFLFYFSQNLTKSPNGTKQNHEIWCT